MRHQAHKKMSNKTGFTLVCYSFKNIIFFFLGKVKQNPFPAKQKRPEHLILQAFQPFPEQGMRESNSRQRFWRPLSYHLTNPLYIKYYEGAALIYYIHLSFVFQYLFFCTFKTSHRSLPLKPFGQALDRLVAVRSTHCCASTPVLST